MDNNFPKNSQLHAFEQAIAVYAENVPTNARRAFEGFLSAGFSDEQSLKLTIIYINSLMGGNLSVN